MQESFTLLNGITIPQIAFGTWRLPDTEETTETIKKAVKTGYRHIDTAAKYANEASVGRAVRECGVQREDMFVTSKLRNTERGYETTLKDFDRALHTMGLDYLDLYLIHWPAPADFYPDWKEINAGTWKAMEELHIAGKIRAIGISNFWPHHIEALKETAEVMPMVNQIKIHPGMLQEGIVEYCWANNILVEAYSPLGAGKLLEDPKLCRIAERYQKSPAQICLKWCLQHGVIPLPKSSSERRMKQNLELFDFEIDKKDMKTLDHLDIPEKEVRDPDKVNLD